MTSKQQDVVESNISPVLFMTVDGVAMTFYLRPGPVKCDLKPLIEAGGGLLCNVQQPGTVLLIDPAERESITASTTHRWVERQMGMTSKVVMRSFKRIITSFLFFFAIAVWFLTWTWFDFFTFLQVTFDNVRSNQTNHTATIWIQAAVCSLPTSQGTLN